MPVLCFKIVLLSDMQDSDKNTNIDNNGDKDSSEEECNLHSNLILQLCLIGIQVFYFLNLLCVALFIYTVNIGTKSDSQHSFLL